MKRIRNLSVALFALSCATAASADVLDLTGAYRLALDNDRRLSAASRDHDAVRERLSQARRLYLPDVSIGYDRTETSQDILDSENEVFGQGSSSYPTDEYGLTINQPLLRMDLVAERNKAREALRNSEYSLQAEQNSLLLRTAEAYLAILAAQENLALARTEEELLKSRLDGAEKRFSVGVADATEVYESRARYELTRAEVVVADNRLADARQALAVIVGQPVEQVRVLGDDYPVAAPEPVDPDHWLDLAEQSNPRMLAALAAVEVAAGEVKRQRADHYPTLDLSVSHGNRTTGGSLFGGGSEVDTTDVMVQFELPVYRGGRTRSRAEEAAYLLQKTRDEAEQLRRNLRRETLAAFRDVQGGISRLSALQASVDSHQLNLKAKRRGFETGTNSNIEVLDAQRDLYLVNRDYANARYDFITSSLRLREQAGQLGEEDLARVNGHLAATAATGGGQSADRRRADGAIDVAGLARALQPASQSGGSVTLTTVDGMVALELPERELALAEPPDADGCGIRLPLSYPVFASMDYVDVHGDAVTVRIPNLRVRSRPSTAADSVVLGVFRTDRDYPLLEQVDGWVKLLGPVDIELCDADRTLARR